MRSFRTNSSITPMRLPCSRSSISATARRSRAKSMTGAWASCPISRRASAWRRPRREVFEAKPDVEGLILHKHGIFTFGESAREAYERMIEMVSLAESRLRQGRPVVFPARALAAASASAAEIAPIIRGAVAIKSDGAEPIRFIANFRTAPEILSYVNGAELASYSQRGVVTPDHIIRTKNRPLVVPQPEAGRLEAFADAVREAVAKFAAEYDTLFPPRERGRGRGQDQARLGAARRARAGRRPVRSRPHGEGREHGRRPRREHDPRRHRCRSDRPLRAAARERPLRARILEPRTGEAQRRRGEAAHRSSRARDRRRRDRRRDGEGARRRGRRCRDCRYRRREGAGTRPPPSRASGCNAT